jgi:signal peptide peptidase SppA
MSPKTNQDAMAALAIAASETWLIERKRGEALLRSATTFIAERSPSELAANRLERMRPEEGSDDPGYTVEDRVARVELAGVVMKNVPWVMSMCGGAAGAQQVQAAIERAVKDPAVDAILLVIDSPGGTLAGTQELADVIYAARAEKPIVAYASDLACSAAYWIGCQATEFLANETASIGSIGVYRTLVDSSRAYENEGLRVHLVRSAPQKGVGVDGIPITAEQLVVEQALIDQAADLFIGAVARGRSTGADRVRPLATGRTWYAPEAKDLGLIDDITSLAGAHARARSFAPALAPLHPPAGAARAIQGAPPMSNTNSTLPSVATSPAEMELRAQLDAANAARALAEHEAAIQTKALDERVARERTAMVDRAQADGRVTPAMRPDVDQYASQCARDTPRLERFLASLPVQTRPEAKGKGSVGNVSEPVGADAEDEKVARLLGLDLAEMQTLGAARAITFSGEILK